MATLTIRKLPQEVYDRLRIRAAENKRSMEAEARDIFAKAFPPPKLGRGDVLRSVASLEVERRNLSGEDE